ncbi:hypothetical protein HpBT289_02160 [Helicobacter pylori]
MQFLNQSLGFFNKGHFEPIDRNFVTEGYQALNWLVFRTKSKRVS